jgi:hypothetical protein
VWTSSTALWSPVYQRYPDRPDVVGRMGRALLSDGRKQEAAKLFVLLHRRFPAYDELACNQAKSYLSLGDQATAMARLQAAVLRGDEECTALLVQILVSAPSAPRGIPAQVVRKALSLALPKLQGRRSASYFQALAARLQELGLAAEAGRVRRLAATAPP